MKTEVTPSHVIDSSRENPTKVLATRWKCFCTAAALVLLSLPRFAMAFGYNDVVALAKAEAGTAYRPPAQTAPPELAQLSYDQLRDIRFRPDHALWRADRLPFELAFFHLGKYQTEPV